MTASTPTWRRRPSGPPCESRGVVNVAAQSELPPARTRATQWAPPLAGACALLLLAATAEIVLDGAVGHSPLIPKSPEIAGWLSGIGERLGFRVFLIAVLAFSAGYAGLIAAVRGDLQTLGDRADRGFARDRVHRSDPALDRRLQLHRLCADGRRTRAEPLHARADRDLARSRLPLRRPRLEEGRHRLRPDLHADLLPVRPARRERRDLGDEVAGAALERRHARAHVALRARACDRPGEGGPDRRRQPAVRDLRARRRAQRPADDGADDGRRRADLRRARRLRRRRRSSPERSSRQPSPRCCRS